MYTLLLALIILVAVLLSVIILLQSGKGGGLAATFGGASSSTESFIGGRQAANLLTKLSWVGGGLFLFLALILSILSARSSGPQESILRDAMGGGTQGVPEAPTSVLESERTGSRQGGEEGAGGLDVLPRGGAGAASGAAGAGRDTSGG